MNVSDIIQLAGILISLITSIIAIGISVKTLKQNSQMIEESTRPYISIYGVGTHIDRSRYYIVLKNFGQSCATINSFTYNFDLAKCAVDAARSEPFQAIENTTIAPGQSFHALIDLNKTLKQTKSINIHIRYSSAINEYEEEFCLNLIGNKGNLENHETSPGRELAIVSETLQAMYIHSL